MARRILIVEDEEKIARFTELELQHEGYETGKAGDGRTGLAMAESGEYDLILLDVLLPELNGLEVLRRLRKHADLPVILLTARDAVMDKVAGLDMGADDYVTKPFAIEELLARIRAALKKRERSSSSESVLSCGQLTLDPARHTVRFRDREVELTGREFAMLELMLRNKGIVLSRETFLERVWGYDYMGETNIVDVYIRSLRSKLMEGGSLIRTVRGVGYSLREEADG